MFQLIPSTARQTRWKCYRLSTRKARSLRLCSFLDTACCTLQEAHTKRFSGKIDRTTVLSSTPNVALTMSSTVIEQNTPRRLHSHHVVAMDEEKISSDSLKLSLESMRDITTSPKVTSPPVGKAFSKSTGSSSLHSVATALTNLTKTPKTDDSQVDDKSEDFEIPLRFTKSGRKRAIPFPLKVSPDSER